MADGPAIGIEPIAKGFKQPLSLCNPIANHLYIADKFGYIHLLIEGNLLNTPVLDISDKLVMEHGEQGLLGLEFHPNFKKNRKVYIRYSKPPGPESPQGYSHTFTLSEFRTTEDYQKIIPESERPILEISEPGKMHNAGAIEFGPDGFLYVAVGDGGGDGHDGSGPFNVGPNSHAGDWYWPNVGGNGQDKTANLLGSVLRIDINDSESNKPYAIPNSNPLVNQKGLGEHYAWGFRNPYSMAFDGEELYVADVGTRMYEEVNLVKKGGNYGWNIKEAKVCHNNFPPLRAVSAADIKIRELPVCPDAAPNGKELSGPVISYPHPPGVAVIGGAVYRGSKVPSLTDKYVFGDLVGRLFAAQPSATDELWEIEELFVNMANQSEPSKQMSSGPLAIEKGRDGELYCLTAGTNGGRINRITKE